MFKIQENGHWIVFGCVLVVGSFACLHLYQLDKFSLIYYGDAVSHLVGARRLVDWRNPGLQQLGTVWLPVPHVILLPLTLIDYLFTSGLAGALVSLLSLATAATFLYKLTHNATKSLTSGFVAAALFALNPNVLYLGLAPMTEGPFLMFLMTSAYFFQRWNENRQDAGKLFWCSLFVLLATLTRYEAWVLPVFLVPYTIVRLVNLNASPKTKVRLLLLSFGSTLGIFIWLVYNWVAYGNMFEFASVEYYSAASQAATRPIRSTLFLQPFQVLSTYASVAQKMYGTIQLLAVAAGLLILLIWKNDRNLTPSFVFLVLPPLFTLISLFAGVAELSDWFNSRYLVLAAPAFSTLSVLSLTALRRFKPIKIRVVIAAAAAGLLVSSIGSPFISRVVTHSEARSGFEYKANPSAVQAGLALSSVYDYGIITMMTGSAQEHRIMVTSGIHLKLFDELIESSTWKRSYTEPWLFGRWLVMSKEPDSDAVAVLDYWKKREKELNDHYSKMYENEYFEIFLIK